MPSALVLIDLQNDYLDSPGLEPAAGAVVERAAALLERWRERGEPVVHVWTTVARGDDRRMPHWRDAGIWRCEQGTPGHATPAPLEPRAGERVVHKTDYDGFGGTSLADDLAALDAGAVVLAGTHLHACVRQTALGAYRRRLGVTIAEDAVASDDPLHAAATRGWLERRGIAFAPAHALMGEGMGPGTAPDTLPTVLGTGSEHGAGGRLLVHEPPARTGRIAWGVAAGGEREVAAAVAAARAAASDWAAAGAEARAALLGRLASALAEHPDELADAIVADAGKPVTQAREEVARTLALLAAARSRADEPAPVPCGPDSAREDRPLGTVALITPWNNPLALAAGKIAPALAFGNTVAWKPAPAGTGVAVRLMRIAAEAGMPPGVLTMVAGDASTAALLMAHDGVDAVSLTGGAAAGWAAQAACARRHVPLQAELGGNSAALVAADADLAAAAAAIARGAFDFAGQRCTANRRVIVERSVLGPFTEALESATAGVAWGRPEDPATTAGPVISGAARDRVEATIARALAAGATSVAGLPRAPDLEAEGAYTPPAVLRCDDPAAEIVQEETFGPVLVLQPADDWRAAIDLANGVRHGLAAAAFTSSPEAETEFLRHIRAGIVKLGTSTAGADVEAPFGGWKHSGVGPPEHGEANRAFYTRPRAVYRDGGVEWPG